MTWWLVGAAVALAACMPTDGPTERPEGGAVPVPTEYPVRLSQDEVAAAGDEAGCTVLPDRGAAPSANHVEEDAPPASELYDRRPPTAGDHLGAWLGAGVHDEPVDERAVVHNHEHGAASVWYVPDAISDGELATLRAWTEARNAELANDAGAGILLAPFPDGLEGDAVVAYRAWSGGLDCAAFDVVVADGFLLERFGDAPEGHLAPDLGGVVEATTSA